MAAKKKAVRKKSAKAVSPLRVGNAVFVQTVTYAYTGRVVAFGGGGVVLADAAWIADTGRFADAMRTGVLDEVEPFAEGQLVEVGLGAVVATIDWPHMLPRAQK